MDLTPIPSAVQAPFAAVLPAADDIAAAVEQQTQNAAPDSFPTDIAGELQSQVASIERTLTRFTQALSRELDSLEKRFASVIKSFVGSIHHLAREAGTTAAAPRSVSPYDGIVKRAAERHDLDPSLVEAVIRQESGFHPDAVSRAGAVGLMQLMPDTARDLGVNDPFDPAANVEGGTRLLRSLIDRYDGRIDLALAAYNAGPAAVDRFGGVPPYPETRAYVDSIMSRYRADALAKG